IQSLKVKIVKIGSSIRGYTRMDKVGTIFSNIPQVLITLMFAAVIGAVTALILAGLGDSTTNVDADNVISNATLGVRKVFEQFGTVGTVIGVMLILGAVLFFLGRGKSSGL